MAVTTASVLVSSQDSEPFRIEAGSLDFASRAVLSQQLPREEKWHLVAFYSKSLSPVKWNYEIHNKEMLAIICALEEWRHFLKGAQYLVEIWTDHKNVEYFMMAKKLNCRQVLKGAKGNLLQMATYWFVIDGLDIWKAQKSKVRQAANDVVKSEV